MSIMYVNEIFFSIQGEGKFTGTPAMFLRLQGCPIACGFCDTKHTWKRADLSHRVDKSFIVNKAHENSSSAALSLKDIYDIWAEHGRLQHIVITGGEPLVQADAVEQLVSFFAQFAPKVQLQLETSGTFEISPVLAFKGLYVTISPKFNQNQHHPVLIEQALLRANEVKMVVEDFDDVALMLSHKTAHNIQADIYLQPKSQSKEATDICVAACLEWGFKLSLQTHKFIGVQ